MLTFANVPGLGCGVGRCRRGITLTFHDLLAGRDRRSGLAQRIAIPTKHHITPHPGNLADCADLVLSGAVAAVSRDGRRVRCGWRIPRYTGLRLSSGHAKRGPRGTSPPDEGRAARRSAHPYIPLRSGIFARTTRRQGTMKPGIAIRARLITTNSNISQHTGKEPARCRGLDRRAQ